MTPVDAAKLLDLPADASPEQLEARFQELRAKLEDKIAKAPTPGLKAKYRESLDELTTAFETLTLASDSSSLPVIQKQGAGSKEHGGGVPSPRADSDSGLRSQVSGFPAAKPKSGGREFAIVAAIAVIVLAGGGWFVLKTRAENAEKARVAAEQKAEAERQAEEARVAAEAKKKAEEEEKLSLAAAEKAEQERREKLLASLRSRLAELNVTAEALFRDEPAKAARVLSDLKSDERSLSRDASAPLQNRARARLAAQQAYVDQVDSLLARHPAKHAQARAAELLSARQPAEAETALVELAGHLQAIEQALVIARQQADQTLQGALSVEVGSQYGDVAWTLTDAFGEKQSGTGSRQLDRVAIGAGEITFSKPGWPLLRREVILRAGQPGSISADFRAADLSITTQPAGAEVRVGAKLAGKSPLTFSVIPDEQVISVSLPGYKTATIKVAPQPGETIERQLNLEKEPVLTDAEIAAFRAALPTTGVVRSLAVVQWSAQRVAVPGTEDRIGVCFFTFRPIEMSLNSGPPPAQTGWFAESPLQLSPDLIPEPQRLHAMAAHFVGTTAGAAMSVEPRIVSDRNQASFRGGAVRIAQTAVPISRPEVSVPPVEGTYALLTGLLNLNNPSWMGKSLRAEASSNPAFATTMTEWLRQSARFRLTGEPAKVFPLVYVLVKHRAPTRP